MKKALSGWQLFGIFVIFFILFGVTKLVVFDVIGIIVLIAAVVTGVNNRLKSQKKQHGSKH